MATKTMAARTAVPWVAEVCSSARQSSAAAVVVAAVDSVAAAVVLEALAASAVAASAEAVPEARGKPVFFSADKATHIARATIAKTTKTSIEFVALAIFLVE